MKCQYCTSDKGQYKYKCKTCKEYTCFKCLDNYCVTDKLCFSCSKRCGVCNNVAGELLHISFGEKRPVCRTCMEEIADFYKEL